MSNINPLNVELSSYNGPLWQWTYALITNSAQDHKSKWKYGGSVEQKPDEMLFTLNLHSLHQAGICYLHSWPCHYRDEGSHDRYLTLHYPPLTFSVSLSWSLIYSFFFLYYAFNLPALYLDLSSFLLHLLHHLNVFPSSILDLPLLLPPTHSIGS